MMANTCDDARRQLARVTTDDGETWCPTGTTLGYGRRRRTWGWTPPTREDVRLFLFNTRFARNLHLYDVHARRVGRNTQITAGDAAWQMYRKYIYCVYLD
jgi:hypothetical protein